MTSQTLGLRIVPPELSKRWRANRVLERNVMVYRRMWVVVFSGFFEPLFYLFSLGVGLGQFVGTVEGPGGVAVEYTAFVAPALLAASAMNGAVFESTMNIFFKLKWAKVYDTMLATPIEVRDIAAGEIAWSQIRGALYAAGFLIVAAGFGLVQSWWGLAALPAAMLIGFAFGAVGMAATTYMKSWQDFDLVTLFTLPLFLFSDTFFPVSVLPEFLQPVALISPLYHGVQIVRGLTVGVLEWSLLGNVAFLIAMTVVGLTITSRRLESLLKS